MRRLKSIPFDFQVLLFALFSMEILEAWRNFAWRFFTNQEFRVWGLILPVIPVSVYGLSFGLLKSKLLRAFVAGFGIFFIGLLQQLTRVYEIGIIITVLYLVIGGAAAGLLYIDRFSFIGARLKEISRSSDAESKRQAIELCFQECRFYLDKMIMGILTAAAIVGVMMTILWQTPTGIFGLSTHEERAIRAIEIVIAFLLMGSAAALWLGLPLMSYISECSRMLISDQTGGAEVDAFHKLEQSAGRRGGKAE